MSTRKSTAACTPREEKFAMAMVDGATAADAYRKAYDVAKMKPEAIRQEAQRVARRAIVRRRIAQIREQIAQRFVLEKGAILREIGRLALADPRGIVDADGRLKLLNQLDEHTAAAVASFEITDKGGVKYRFHDKNSALEKACKILGLFELDNSQKKDPLAELLARLGGKVVGVTASNAATLPDDEDD